MRAGKRTVDSSAQLTVRETQIARLVATGATMLAIGLTVGGWLFSSRKAHTLTEKDTIVLADFINTTGDTVFEGTLRQGLAVQLQQSPFLSLVSDEQIQQAADYFGALKAAKWTEVKEAATVPKTFIGGGRMRYASPEGGTEPIGARVITLPQDQSRVTKRDPHSGFVSYVPVGSVKKGEALVKTGGGKSVQCTICHGDTLTGLGNVPRLAGRRGVNGTRVRSWLLRAWVGGFCAPRPTAQGSPQAVRRMGPTSVTHCPFARALLQYIAGP